MRPRRKERVQETGSRTNPLSLNLPKVVPFFLGGTCFQGWLGDYIIILS